jgi:pimeloyl-ACP methyl ester carboxylesterase
MAFERTTYEEKYWTVGNHRIRGVDEGEGPTLVLLHGLASRLEEYDGLMKLLTPHFRVLVWDQPGDGFSSDPGYPQPLHERADIVADVIRHLGLKKVYLLGASQGGFIALKLMARHPDLIEKSLLISPAGGWEPKPWLSSAMDALADNPARVPVYWISGLIQQNLCYYWKYPGRLEKLKGFIDFSLEQDIPDLSRRYFFSTAMAMADSVLEEVDQIKTPVRMLWGEHDYGMPPSQGDALLERMSTATLEKVPECGHAMATEMPEFVRDKALEWFV